MRDMTRTRTFALAAGGAALAAAFAMAGAPGTAEARPSVWIDTPGFSLYAGPGYGGGYYGGYGYRDDRPDYYSPYIYSGPRYGYGYSYGYWGSGGSRYDGLYRRNWKNRAFSGE